MKYNLTFDELNNFTDELKSILKFNMPNYNCMYLHTPKVYRDDIHESYDSIIARISIFCIQPYTNAIYTDYVGIILDNGAIVNITNPLLKFGHKNLDFNTKLLIGLWINSIESKERQNQRCSLIKSELIKTVAEIVTVKYLS
jgi:hypothetical protein